MIFVRDIKRETAKHFGLPVETMDQRFGEWPVAHKRQAAMCLAARLTDQSYKRIGDLFGGRDHTTVLHAIRQTEQRRRNDLAIAKALREVTFTLLREAGR